MSIFSPPKALMSAFLLSYLSTFSDPNDHSNYSAPLAMRGSSGHVNNL